MTTRTYEYDDRPFDPRIMLSISGLDYMRGLIAGEFAKPPIADTLGFQLIEVDHGRALFEGTPGRFVYNPIGSVHGGFAATLLDSCLGCCVHTTLPAGKAYTTVDLAVTYVRALTDKVGPVRAEGKVIHTGGSIITAEGRITDAKGTLYAHGTTTCLVLTPR
ncbi:MAG TPA: PaaI family thioesterase [Kofleriaceae bacterium]